MNVDVPKKVLNRKLRKRRRAKPTIEEDEPEIKETKLDQESGDESEDGAENGNAEPQNETVPTAVTTKSSILTKVKFDGLKGKVADRTLNKLKGMGFEFMTEIQSKAIEPLLEVSHYY